MRRVIKRQTFLKYVFDVPSASWVSMRTVCDHALAPDGEIDKTLTPSGNSVQAMSSVQRFSIWRLQQNAY